MKLVSSANLSYFWGKVKTYIANAVNTAKTAVGNYTVNGKKISTNPVLSKGDVGLGSVDNVQQIPMSQKGAANGVAELDENGFVSAWQLPAFVDDIVEFGRIVPSVTKLNIGTPTTNVMEICYNLTTKTFIASMDMLTGPTVVTGYTNWGGIPDSNIAPSASYGITGGENGITPVAGKIYVDLQTNKVYRWSGSDLVVISDTLALGTTSNTAFRGDQGKTAYDHAAAKGSAFAAGLYKITTNAQGHVTAATAVTKDDITKLGIPGSNTTYGLASSSQDGLMSKGDKSKLDGIATGANNYVHPNHSGANTGNTTGLYKVKVDTLGHVVGVVPVTKADITGLGIPAQDTTYTVATTTKDGLMSKTDKAKLNTAVVTSDIEFMTDAEVDALFA